MHCKKNLQKNSDYIIFSDDDMIWHPPTFHNLLSYLNPAIPWISTGRIAVHGDYHSQSLFNRNNNPKNFMYSHNHPGQQITLPKYLNLFNEQYDKRKEEQLSSKDFLSYGFTFAPIQYLIDDCRQFFFEHLKTSNRKGVSDLDQEKKKDFCSLCAGETTSQRISILKPYYGFANPLLASKAAINTILPSLIEDGLFSICWQTGFTHDRALALYFLLHEVPTWSVFHHCFKYFLKQSQSRRRKPNTIPDHLSLHEHGDVGELFFPPFLQTKDSHAMRRFIYRHEHLDQNFPPTTTYKNVNLPTCFFNSLVAGYNLNFLHNTTWYNRTGGISRAKLLNSYPLRPYTIIDCALQQSSHYSIS